MKGERPVEDNVNELIDDVRIAAESSAAAQMVVSLDSGEVLYVNPAASRFYGWKEETLTAMFIDDLDPGLLSETRANMFAAGSGAIASAAIRTMSRSHFVSSGDRRDVDLFAGTMSTKNAAAALLHVVIRESKGAGGAGGVVVDKKTVESIVHDFNNQLTVIRGVAALLREYEREISTLTNDLDIIDRATDRSVSLLHRLREHIG